MSGGSRLRHVNCCSVHAFSHRGWAGTVRREGCDGRRVQASPSDASRLEYCSMFLQCMSSYSVAEDDDSSHTCAAGVNHHVGQASTGEACTASGATSPLSLKTQSKQKIPTPRLNFECHYRSVPTRCRRCRLSFCRSRLCPTYAKLVPRTSVERFLTVARKLIRTISGVVGIVW